MPAAVESVSPVPEDRAADRPERRPPLPALTGLRTLLACNIVFFHFNPPHMGLIAPFIANGFVFVGFFFMLSGYVLAYNYADRALTLSPRAFWTARFARLYPVYVLALLLSFEMLGQEWHAHTRAEFWQGVVLTPLLLQGWSPPLATFWNTVGWTLSAELVLYGAFPWLMRSWARRPQLERPGRLVAIFAGLWLAGMVPHVLYLNLNPDGLPEPVSRYSYGMWLRALKYSPPAYVCMFVAGIAVGKLQLRLALSERQRLVLAAAGVAAVGGLFYTVVPRIPYLLLHGGLLMPLFAVLTLGLSGSHAIAAAFAWRPLLLVGESTFCLYMLHFNAINLLHVNRVWERLHLAAWDPWVSYAVALVLALAAHRWVEGPARGFLLRRLGGRRGGREAGRVAV